MTNISLFKKIDHTATPTDQQSVDSVLAAVKNPHYKRFIELARKHGKSTPVDFEDGTYYVDYDEYNNVFKYEYIQKELNQLLFTNNELVFFTENFSTETVKKRLDNLGIKYHKIVQVPDFYSFFEYKLENICFVSLVWGGFDTLKQEKTGKKGEFKLVLRNLYTFVKSTKIPVVTWNASFNDKRSLKSISSLSGYIYMDVDDFSEITQENVFNILQDNALEFVQAAWKSFGGNGYGFLVKVNGLTIDNFKWNWQEITKKFQTLGIKIDKATKDITRINVLSYDPQMFIRENCKSLSAITNAPENELQIKIDPLKNEVKAEILEQTVSGLYYDDSFFNQSEKRLSYRFYQVLFSKLNHIGITLDETMNFLSNRQKDYPEIFGNPRYSILDIQGFAKSQYDTYSHQFGTITVEKQQYVSEDYVLLGVFKQYDGDVHLKLNDIFEKAIRKEQGDVNAAILYFALVAKRTGILIAEVKEFLEKKFGYNPETQLTLKKIYNNAKYQFGVKTKMKDSAIAKKRNTAIENWEKEGKVIVYYDNLSESEIQSHLVNIFNKIFKTTKISEKNVTFLCKNYFKECNSFNISQYDATQYLTLKLDFHSIERYAKYYGKEIYESLKPYRGIRVQAPSIKKKITKTSYLKPDQKLGDLNLKVLDNTILWADTNMGKTTWACASLEGKRVILVPTVGALKNIETKYNAATYYEANKNVTPENELIVCTYSSAPKLFTLMRNWEGGLSQYTLIVDEQHNFAVSAAKNYRNSELNFVMDNISAFKKRIFMTGTLFPVEHPAISQLDIYRVKWKNQPKKEAQIVWCADKYKSIENNLVRGKKNIIYLQDKRMHKQLGKLVDYLQQKQWKKIYLLNANEKNEAHFKDLITTEYLAKDAEVIITTSVTVEAINILDLDVATVHFMTFENPRLMEQMVNRMRRQLPTQIFIYKKIKSTEETIENFDPIVNQKDLIEQSHKLLQFLSTPKQKKRDSYDQVAAQKLFANHIFEKTSLFRVKDNGRQWDIDYLSIANKIFNDETSFCKNNFEYFKTVLEEYGWEFLPDVYFEEKMTKEESVAFEVKKEAIEKEMAQYSLDILEKVEKLGIDQLKKEVENKAVFDDCKYPDLEWTIRIKLLKLSKYMDFSESCRIVNDWITTHERSEKIFEAIMREIAVKIAKISDVFETDCNLQSKFSQSVITLYFQEKEKNITYNKAEIAEFFNRRKKLNPNLKEVDGEKYAIQILSKYFEILPVLEHTEVKFKLGGLNVANDVATFSKEFYEWAAQAHESESCFTSDELSTIITNMRGNLPFLSKIKLTGKNTLKLLSDYVTLKKTTKRFGKNVKTSYKIDSLEPKLTKGYEIKINQQVFYTNYINDELYTKQISRTNIRHVDKHQKEHIGRSRSRVRENHHDN
jgi:hypothetical protein